MGKGSREHQTAKQSLGDETSCAVKCRNSRWKSHLTSGMKTQSTHFRWVMECVTGEVNLQLESRLRMMPFQRSRLPPVSLLPPLCIPAGFPSAVSPVSYPLPYPADRALHPQRILLMEQSWVWLQENHIKPAHTERAHGLWVLVGNLACL